MSPSCPRDCGEGGFTLIEVTVAMSVLIIVLVLSGTLLMSMKSFAQKQQSFAEPRQTARRAMNYLSYYLRGASDANMEDTTAPMPDALVTHYNLAGTTMQATYNNVTNSTLADLGTDILTLTKPVAGAMPLTVYGWDGLHTTTSLSVLYTQGCGNSNNDTTNLSLFEQAVGYSASSTDNALFLICDPAGYWQYYQVNAVPVSHCSNASASPPNVMSLSVLPGGAYSINPPGSLTPIDLTCSDGNPCFLAAGLQFVTFRVRTVNGTPRLEQLVRPDRIFDSGQDNPGTGFMPLLDNVEDLQVAYIYGDGTIWNTANTSRLLQSPDYPDNVPYMRPKGVAAKTYDAVNVRGVRLSVVARSAQLIPTFLGGPGRKTLTVTPPEDSTVTYAQGYYHYRITATVMIQNRILGY